MLKITNLFIYINSYIYIIFAYTEIIKHWSRKKLKLRILVPFLRTFKLKFCKKLSKMVYYIFFSTNYKL